jgi:hypothetical protein
MSWIPRFKIYDVDLNLKITIPNVSYTNAPQSIKKSTLIEGIRGNGGIVVSGSKSTWDLILRGVLIADNYEALTVLIDNLESTIEENVQYILKIDKTISTTYTYNVIRLEPINYSESLRNNYQEFEIILKVLS